MPFPGELCHLALFANPHKHWVFRQQCQIFISSRPWPDWTCRLLAFRKGGKDTAKLTARTCFRLSIKREHQLAGPWPDWPCRPLAFGKGGGSRESQRRGREASARTGVSVSSPPPGAKRQPRHWVLDNSHRIKYTRDRKREPAGKTAGPVHDLLFRKSSRILGRGRLLFRVSEKFY